MIAETKDVIVQDTVRELTVAELDQVAGGRYAPSIHIEDSFNNSFNGVNVSGIVNNSFNTLPVKA